MNPNIKHIIKQILLEQEQKKQDVPQFSVDDAFRFLQDKEGKRPPLPWLLKNTPEDIIPSDLNWNRPINLVGSDIEYFPAAKATNIMLNNCKNLKKIDEGLIARSLSIEGCELLKALPDGLHLDKLYMKGSGVLNFPDNLKIIHELRVGINDLVIRKMKPKNFDPFDIDDVNGLRQRIKRKLRDRGGYLRGPNINFDY